MSLEFSFDIENWYRLNQMMRAKITIPYFHVDAFTSRVFSGNPAGVCPLEQWLDDDTLLWIAAENNLL
jgi:hypothetical protein